MRRLPLDAFGRQSGLLLNFPQGAFGQAGSGSSRKKASPVGQGFPVFADWIMAVSTSWSAIAAEPVSNHRPILLAAALARDGGLSTLARGAACEGGVR